MDIHYELGPVELQVVSIDQSNIIISLLQEHYSQEEISELVGVSIEAVEQVRLISASGLRRCWICGEVFDPHETRRSICYKEEHYLPCMDCGTPVKVTDNSYAMYKKHGGGNRCRKCRGKQIGLTRKSKSQEEKDAIIAKQRSTMMERYGAPNPVDVPEIKAKMQATIKERYGVDNLSQSPEIQRRIRENSQKKYGVDHYTQSPEIRKHMEDGMVAKYGVKNAQQCPEIQEKTKATNLERYGVGNVLQSKEIQDGFKAHHNH